ncbi:MAG TPA: ATP-binding protein [Candidatus Angelobacter sp.]
MLDLSRPNPEHDLRVLVVAPTGRDSLLICNLLSSNGIQCENSPTTEMARIGMTMGAGAVILTDEILTLPEIAEWTAQIAKQPSWSDFPLIILTIAGQVDHESQRKLLLRQPLGNLVLLERPVRPETLVSTVQAALRSRRRQYQIRDHLAERCKAEEALRKSEKLAVAGRLAASMAHEINNPLESVVNLLYLISKCSFPEESFKYTQMAMSELARVSEIVTQTLKFHRQQSKPGMVQITEIVESALALYQGRLISARIVIEKDFRECQPIFAMAGELRQMIVNLVGNAVDAMAISGGTLKVRITNTRERSNGTRPGIRLTISDTGSGIHPEIKMKLFEPFISTKGDTGTGLGLWVSYGIVQKHGGTIQVKSSVIPRATGTVFSVFLPLQPQFGVIPAPPDNLLITTVLRSTQQCA